MYAQEADILARLIAVHLHELQQQPNTLYVSERRAVDMFTRKCVNDWKGDLLIFQYQQKDGRIKYKLSELNKMAAERQYPFWKIKPVK